MAQVDQNEDNGLQLRAGTMTVQHIARLDEIPFSFTDMQNGGCANTTPTAIAPGATADYTSLLDYYLGGSSSSMAPGASQTVVVQYQRV